MNTSNMLKTTILLGTLTGLLVLIGSAIGGTGGMIFAFGFAILMNMGAWYFSDKLALAMSGAKEASPQDAPELHRMVEDLAARANMPKPRVYLIESEMPNAFATGRDPQHAAVAATTGIMSILTRDELAGVMAHELAHIKHRDTLVSSVAATIAGAITMLADMAMWALIFGGFGGSDEEEGGAAGAVGGILMIFLAPIAAVIIQLAISRSREFGADEGGARILGDPRPLANALEKLEAWSMQRMQLMQSGMAAPVEQPRPATAHLYIAPVPGGTLLNLFRTHPPTEARVMRLRDLANTPEFGSPRRVMA
ncbi:MAG: zinc metalloprotease HtpX [bacterium]|nr:zinc metalloprotease HtpX [bacterium]